MSQWTPEQQKLWHDAAVGMFYREQVQAQFSDDSYIHWEDLTLAQKLHYQALAKKELRAILERPHKVVIEVSGGIAECTQQPEGVEVEIIDHDNEEDEPIPCRECGEPSDNGEGWDGYCGNCADQKAQP